MGQIEKWFSFEWKRQKWQETLTFPNPPSPPLPPAKSFCKPTTAAMTNAILARTKALVAIKARPPKRRGITAKTLAPTPMRMGRRDFLIFPRPESKNVTFGSLSFFFPFFCSPMKEDVFLKLKPHLYSRRTINIYNGCFSNLSKMICNSKTKSFKVLISVPKKKNGQKYSK